MIVAAPTVAPPRTARPGCSRRDLRADPAVGMRREAGREKARRGRHVAKHLLECRRRSASPRQAFAFGRAVAIGTTHALRTHRPEPSASARALRREGRHRHDARAAEPPSGASASARVLRPEGRCDTKARARHGGSIQTDAYRHLRHDAVDSMSEPQWRACPRPLLNAGRLEQAIWRSARWPWTCLSIATVQRRGDANLEVGAMAMDVSIDRDGSRKAKRTSRSARWPWTCRSIATAPRRGEANLEARRDRHGRVDRARRLHEEANGPGGRRVSFDRDGNERPAAKRWAGADPATV